MKERTRQLTEKFFEENSRLEPCGEAILNGAKLLTECFKSGGKLLVCGNGGSCADGGHIAGELMKGFLLKRPLSREAREKFGALFGTEGLALAERLQCALPTISLGSHNALLTAVGNDLGYDLVFAQQVMGYALPGDAVLGISTSGNAENVRTAMMAARARGASCMALTGERGGAIAPLADVWIPVPEERTFRVQEHHGAVYHFLCAYAESEIFNE